MKSGRELVAFIRKAPTFTEADMKIEDPIDIVNDRVSPTCRQRATFKPMGALPGRMMERLTLELRCMKIATQALFFSAGGST